jgi:hypothetical protein
VKRLDDHVVSMVIVVEDEPVELVLEPWGEEHAVADGSKIDIVISGPEGKPGDRPSPGSNRDLGLVWVYGDSLH